MLKSEHSLYKTIYQQQREVINRNNIQTLRVFSISVSIIAILFMMMIPFLYSDHRRITIISTFAVMVFIFVALFFIAHTVIKRKVNQHHIINGLIWFSLATAMLGGIFGNTYLVKNGIGIWFPLFLVVLPSLFLLKLRDIFIFVTISAMTFIILNYGYKEVEYFKIQTFIGFGSLFVSLPYNYMINHLRLKEQYISYTFEKEAYDDVLTDVPNRRSLYRTLEGCLNSDKVTSMAIMAIDIDNLKHINDHFGHMVGDRLIIAAANDLSEFSTFYGYDLSRFGGDEFVIIVTNHSVAYIKNSLNKFFEKPHLKYTSTIDDTEPGISYSIGVFHTDNKQNLSTNVLLKRADDALYEAKNNGKNQFIIRQ